MWSLSAELPDLKHEYTLRQLTEFSNSYDTFIIFTRHYTTPPKFLSHTVLLLLLFLFQPHIVLLNFRSLLLTAEVLWMQTMTLLKKVHSFFNTDSDRHKHTQLTYTGGCLATLYGIWQEERAKLDLTKAIQTLWDNARWQMYSKSWSAFKKLTTVWYDTNYY